MARTHTTSPRYRQKRRTRMVWTAVSILVIVGALAYGAKYLSHIESLQISNIDVTGIELVKKEDVVSSVRSVINGEYAGIISRSFSLIFPEESARAAVLEAVPRIASVDFKNTGSQTIEVVVTERAPDSLVCTSSLPSSQSCIYADKDGFLYAEAPQLVSGGLPKILYSDKSDVANKISVGSAPLGETYRQLIDIVSKARSLGISTNSIFIGDIDDAGYITYEIRLDPEGKIFLNDRVPFAESTEHLELFWKNRRKVTTSGQFEYIDLRFGNNVIYKIRSEL